jgi:hypothetical protein
VALEVGIAEGGVVGEGGGGEAQTPAVVVAIEDVLWPSVVDALGSSPCGGGSCF